MKKLLCFLTATVFLVTSMGVLVFASPEAIEKKDTGGKRQQMVTKLKEKIADQKERLGQQRQRIENQKEKLENQKEKLENQKEKLKEGKEKQDNFIQDKKRKMQEIKTRINRGKQISTINKVYNAQKKEILGDIKEMRKLWKESIKDSTNKSVYKKTYKDDFINHLEILRNELKSNQDAKKDAKLQLIRDISELRKATDDNSTPVFVDGHEVKFEDVPPINKNGRTLLPLRSVVTSMGATVDWNAKENKVTIKKDDKTIELIINKIEFLVNGKPFVLDVPAQIHEGRTVLPIRAIMEALAKKVDWDNESGAVIIQ